MSGMRRRRSSTGSDSGSGVDLRRSDASTSVSEEDDRSVGNAALVEAMADVDQDNMPTLEALEEQAGPRYSHIDITAPLYNIDVAGNFEGDDSVQAYEAARERLVEDGKIDPEDREIRMEMIRGHVAEAETNRALAKESAQDGEDVMGMMMLPEWFLGKNLSKKEMKKNREELAALSEAYPEVLIQPGSAVWQERKKKPGSLFAKQTHMHSDADAYFGGEHKHTTQKMFNGMDTNATRFAYGSNKGEKVGADRKTKWFANAKERELESGDRHLPTEYSTGSRFEAGGRSFALEICGDHGSGGYRTLNEMQQSDDFDPVDVHLVTSNGAALNDKGGVMKDGGLGVQNDAGRGQSYVHSATDAEHMSHVADEHGKPQMRKVAPDQMPEDAEYSRHALEKLAARDLTKEQRGAHLGTYTLPG